MANINFIYASDLNHCIGKDKTLPWGYIPSELTHFKDITKGNMVVMGFETWRSLKHKPLPDRVNMVTYVGSTEGLANLQNRYPDVIFASQAAIREILFNFIANELNRYKDVFIIGGAKTFKHFEDMVDYIYKTTIQTEVEGGDVFYRHPLDKVIQWVEIARSPENEKPHSWVAYKGNARYINYEKAIGETFYLNPNIRNDKLTQLNFIQAEGTTKEALFLPLNDGTNGLREVMYLERLEVLPSENTEVWVFDIECREDVDILLQLRDLVL